MFTGNSKNKIIKSTFSLMIILVLILIILFVISLFIGRYNISIYDRDSYRILLYVRFPRILSSILVGIALSVAGTIYQSLFQNPIASPDILGCSNGAAVGAAFAILLGFSNNYISLFAFFMGIITILIVFFISGKILGDKVVSLILSGIIVSSIFQAIISYIKIIADPSNKLPAITFWLLGSFSNININELLLILVPILICFIIINKLSWHLNILSLGEEEAITLGINAKFLRYLFLIIATIFTAISVAFTGVIGYVGLVIPNLARRIVGNNNKKLVPISALLGGIFMLIVDDVSRSLFEIEIPIGILTAIIGAPFFLYLISKERKRNA